MKNAIIEFQILPKDEPIKFVADQAVGVSEK